MSRGKLDRDTGNKISAGLPNVTEIRRASLHLQPDFLSFGFPPESKIPIASVCLQDVTATLEEVRHALFEALAYILWYRERENPPKEALAIFFGRFYVDDAALRLYAAGEYLAEAIICMLEINSSALTKYRKARKGGAHGSKQSVVGKFLFAEMPGHPITKAISDLVQSKPCQQSNIETYGCIANLQLLMAPESLTKEGIDCKFRQRTSESVLVVVILLSIQLTNL